MDKIMDFLKKVVAEDVFGWSWFDLTWWMIIAAGLLVVLIVVIIIIAVSAKKKKKAKAAVTVTAAPDFKAFENKKEEPAQATSEQDEALRSKIDEIIKPAEPAPVAEKPAPKPVYAEEPIILPLYEEAPAAKPAPAYKPAPKPVAKAEPKPAAKAAPAPAKKAEPKPVAKAEPKPVPKAAEKPAPKAEPKAATVKAAPAAKATPAAKPAPKAVEEPKKVETNVKGKYVIEFTRNGKYRFALLANNGSRLFESEEYASEASCRGGIPTFMKYICTTNIEVTETDKGRFQYVIKRPNGSYSSKDYDTDVAAASAAASVQRFCKTEKIVVIK